MPPHRYKLNDEQRRKLIYSVINEGKSIKDTASEFQVPYVTVYAVINTFRKTGRITALKKGGDRRSKLNQQQHVWISQRVDDKPDISVRQLTQELCEEFGVQVSSSTISRVLAKRGFTVSLIQPDDTSVNPEGILHSNIEMILSECDGQVVYLGEAGYSIYLKQFYGKTSQEDRQEDGESSKSTNQNVSVYLALKENLLVHSDIQIGSFHSNAFTSFVNEVLKNIDDKKHCIIYNSSCPAHQAILQDLVGKTLHSLITLPSHGIFTNPVERGFTFIKDHLRREKPTANDTLLMRFQEALDKLTYKDWAEDNSTPKTPIREKDGYQD